MVLLLRKVPRKYALSRSPKLRTEKNMQSILHLYHSPLPDISRHANLARTYVCMNIGMCVNAYIQTDMSHKGTCAFLYGCNHTSTFSDSVRMSNHTIHTYI